MCIRDRHKLLGARWSNKDSEVEGGAGIVPIMYLPKNPVHALQWAIGLELGLLVESDKVVLTTDFPNGGPFTEYPYVMAMLMSKKMREKELERVSPYVQKAANLPSIDAEKTLDEVMHMTRALSARVLGLENKGHLGVGADADISIYDFNPNEIDTSNDYEIINKAFRNALYTIKGGVIIVKEGQLVDEVWGTTYWVDATNKVDTEAIEEDLDKYFELYYSVEKEHYGVEEAWIKNPTRLVMG